MGGKCTAHARANVRAREEREQQTESILKEELAIFLALHCANNLLVSTFSHTRSAIPL
jgi:hypothetical protein